MLTLKLKENNQHLAIYEFLPNGTDYVGVIGIDKKTKEIKLIDTCAADWKYRAHAFKRMEGYVEQDTYPQEDMVAWH